MFPAPCAKRKRGILQFILAKFLAIFLRKLRKDERSIKDGRLRAEHQPHAKNRSARNQERRKELLEWSGEIYAAEADSHLEVDNETARIAKGEQPF